MIYSYLTDYAKSIKILKDFDLVKFTFTIWFLSLITYSIECNTSWPRIQIGPLVLLLFLLIKFLIRRKGKK